MSHSNRIEQSYENNTKIEGWARFRISVLIFVGLSILAASTYWYFYFEQLQNQEIRLLTAGVVLCLLIITIFIICNTYDIVKQSHRNQIEDQIRIDIYRANYDALSTLLSDIIPGLNKIQNNLPVGEELVREINMVTKRYAGLRSSVTKMHSDMELADGIRAMIESSAEGNDVEADIVSLMKFAENHDPSLKLVD